MAQPPQAVSPPAPKEGEFAGITLPNDRKAKKSLEAAEDFMREEDWGNAAHVLQGLLNGKEELFVELKRKSSDGKTESNQWTSVRIEANRLIGSMPPNGLQVYEVQFGAKARDLLNEARKLPENRANEEMRQKSTAEILAYVAMHYLHTKAGAEAANLLGTYHLDRGRPVMAALCFERLLNNKETEGKLPPTTLLRAAIAFQRVGDKAAALTAWTRLSKQSPAGVPINGKTIPLDDLKKELDRVPVEEIVLSASDWTMFKGNPSRTGQGIGGTPFLDEDVNKWVQPTIRSDQTKQWVDQAIAYQESRQQTATIPAFSPVAAGGKLIFRSYFGVHAVDLKTGKLVWEQDSNWGIDRMLMDNRKKLQINQWVNYYIQGGAQSILYENSTVGMLSSDGNLVFAIDDLTLPPHPNYLQQFMWGGRPNYGDLDDAIHHNLLQAIEVETGKLKWQVGGRGEKGDLNDCFFLGPPLPLGGKLYILVEKNAELRLVCLSAASGELNWSQMLATVREKLTNDISRRVHAVNLAYGDGILVCPTNAGAILGVDLLTHSLVWAKPYREASPVAQEQPVMPNGRRFAVAVQNGYQPYTMLSPEWKCSAPVVQDGKVVFTAPDGSAIYCLNLRDGNTVWKANRSDDLYLGGVYNGKVVLVGKQHCRALNLNDGRQLWSRETGVPSGHGIASDKVYYLPLRAAAEGKDPEVCALDIDTGQVVAHTKTRKREIPGNLIFVEGKVISQTVNNVSAYPQLKVKLAEMDDRLRKDPNDPIGLLERAELRRHDGQIATAVDDLRAALLHKLEEERVPKARQLLFECLTEMFQRDFNASEKYLDEYKEMCKITIPSSATTEEVQKFKDEEQRRQANFLCLVAKGKEQQGKLVEAFNYYREFGALQETTGLLAVIDEPTVKASPNVWAQGRIAAMIAKAQPEQRKPLEDEINRKWQEISAANDVTQLKNFVSVFGSLFAVGNEARMRLAERLMDDNAFIEAELLLLQVRRQDDQQLAGRAVELLARMNTRNGMMEDAAYWYGILGRDFASTLIRDGKTGADFFNELATDKRFLPYLDEQKPVWGKGRVKAREEFGNFQPTHQVFYFEPEGETLPFYFRHRLAFNMNYFQLKLIDRTTNDERWSQNLPRQNNQHLQYLYSPQSGGAQSALRFPYLVQGHMAVYALGTMVFGLDLMERKILWEKDLLGTQAVQGQIIPGAHGGLEIIYPDSRREKIGQSGPFEPGYVCLVTRNGLVALDPVKGSILWTKSDVPAWTQVFGDGQHLYMVEVRPNGNVGASRAVRAHDGVAVDVPDFSDLYQKRLRILGRNLLLTETQPGGVALRLYDVHTGKDLWKKVFAPNAIVMQSEDPDVAGIIEPSLNGKLTLLDLRTQKELMTANVDPTDVQKSQAVYLLRDSDLVYVAINGQINQQQNPWGGPWPNVMNGIRGLPVNGKFYAFNAANGKLQWKTDVSNQVVLLEQFKEMPIILFSARSQRLVNGSVMQATATRSIAKRTGKLLYEKEFHNSGTQFHTLNSDFRNGTIDLISYNMKIQHYLDRGVK